MIENNTLKAFIFDLDGVLCHTDKYHYLAWKSIADELGVEFTPEDNDRLRGVSRIESLEIILEKYNGELSSTEKQELAERKNDAYRQSLRKISSDEMSPNAGNVLAELRKRGYKLAVGSSSKNAPFILDRLGLTDSFDIISDGNNITHSKPHPEVFTKAAEYLGIKPEYCIVVEDAQSGITAAHRAGMKAIAIGDAARCNKAEYNISDLNDILSLL